MVVRTLASDALRASSVGGGRRRNPHSTSTHCWRCSGQSSAKFAIAYTPASCTAARSLPNWVAASPYRDRNAASTARCPSASRSRMRCLSTETVNATAPPAPATTLRASFTRSIPSTLPLPASCQGSTPRNIDHRPIESPAPTTTPMTTTKIDQPTTPQMGFPHLLRCFIRPGRGAAAVDCAGTRTVGRAGGVVLSSVTRPVSQEVTKRRSVTTTTNQRGVLMNDEATNKWERLRHEPPLDAQQ